MNDLTIIFLGQAKQHISKLAHWHQHQWQLISPDQTIESRIQLYSSYPSCSGVPSCLLALRAEKALGSASLVESDLDLRPQLSPWLASVYVDTPYRNQGIATLLIERCLENARLSGYKKLYLFTPDSREFYQKRGWNLTETLIYHGESIDIMYYNLEES